MTKIAVVLAVHNRRDLTERFLKTIVQQSFNSYQIVVVDDGSTDGTSEMIERYFPQVHLLKGDGSLWWSASTNMAVEYAIGKLNAQYICTMNDDTEADFRLLEELYYAAKINYRSIIGCFSYDINQPDRLLYDGSRVNWWTGKISTMNSTKHKYNKQALIPVTYYVGRGVLIPSQVFIDCGYYDAKRFPQSWADNDLIFRAKRAKYRVFSARNARQYIYPDESNHLKLKSQKKLRNFMNYLFVNQGGGNIVAYTKYVLRNYPWYGVPVSLLNGVLSRILGYWKPIL